MTVKEFITDPIKFGADLFAKAKEMQTKTVKALDIIAKIDEELSTMPEPFKMDFICLVTKAVDKCENMNKEERQAGMDEIKDNKYDEFGFFNPFSTKYEEKSEDVELIKKIGFEMTREEAKEILKEKRFEINTRVNGETIFSKALDVAIEALNE